VKRYGSKASYLKAVISRYYLFIRIFGLLNSFGLAIMTIETYRRELEIAASKLAACTDPSEKEQLKKDFTLALDSDARSICNAKGKELK